MKKTWIIILVLAMMMVVLAAGCADKGTPAADTQEPTTAFEAVNLEGSVKIAEADDANFRGSADMDGWKRASDLP